MFDTNQHTTLLVMDVQRNIVERFVKDGDLLERIGGAITNARSTAIPVIYVVVKFRPGYPEISSHNKSFSAVKHNQPPMQAAIAATEVHSAIAPQPSDIIATKRRVSAFTGSDLEVVLRAQGITHLVLCGIASSGVVLSTLREAADKDYQLTVLSDCCIDSDEEVHRVLMTKVFPRQAEIVTAEAWCEMVKQ